MIMIALGNKNSIPQEKKQQWIIVEGIILEISNNYLCLLNSQSRMEEIYTFTRETQIKPEPIFFRKGNVISSGKGRVKDILREGYKIIIKVNPKNQTIIEILIKERPQ